MRHAPARISRVMACEPGIKQSYLADHAWHSDWLLLTCSAVCKDAAQQLSAILPSMPDSKDWLLLVYLAGSKDAAQQLMLAGQLRPFHGLRFVPGHSQTDYGRWLSATAPYPVQYEEVRLCRSF